MQIDNRWSSGREVNIVGLTHQEIKDGQAEHFKSDAHVAVVVEPVEHLDTQTEDEKRGKYLVSTH